MKGAIVRFGFAVTAVGGFMPKQLTLKAAALLLLATVPLASCTSPTSSPSKDTAKLSLEELEVSDYFARDSGVDLKGRVYLVSALKELHERPLNEVGRKGVAYRFIALPSFYKPLCVTAYLPDDGESLITGKQIIFEPRPGKSDPSRRQILKAPQMQLSDEQAATLKKAFKQVNFFWLDQYDKYTRPPLFEFDFNGRHYSSPSEESCIKDGTLWVVEGWDHGAYRVVQRQELSDEDPLRQLANSLLTECEFLSENTGGIY